MYFDFFSRARYTLPNLPLPSGRPMSKSSKVHRLPGPPLGYSTPYGFEAWDRCYDQNFQRFFDNFRGKKMAFWQKTNVTIKILHNLALFCVTNAIFCKVYFKNHNIGLW
jgi:hypothetical protein